MRSLRALTSRLAVEETKGPISAREVRCGATSQGGRVGRRLPGARATRRLLLKPANDHADDADTRETPHLSLIHI